MFTLTLFGACCVNKCTFVLSFQKRNLLLWTILNLIQTSSLAHPQAPFSESLI